MEIRARLIVSGAVVAKICSGCHEFTVIIQVHATKDHWEAVVENMVSRGAEGSDSELDQVVAYLASQFGPVDQKINVNKATAEELSRALSISLESATAIVPPKGMKMARTAPSSHGSVLRRRHLSTEP